MVTVFRYFLETFMWMYICHFSLGREEIFFTAAVYSIIIMSTTMSSISINTCENNKHVFLFTVDWRTTNATHVIPLSGLEFLDGIQQIYIQQTVELTDIGIDVPIADFAGKTVKALTYLPISGMGHGHVTNDLFGVFAVLSYIESENRYLLKIPRGGETLFVAAEKSSSFERQLVGSNRSFQIDFYDQSTQLAFYFSRNLRCSSFICGCCLQGTCGSVHLINLRRVSDDEDVIVQRLCQFPDNIQDQMPSTTELHLHSGERIVYQPANSLASFTKCNEEVLETDNNTANISRGCLPRTTHTSPANIPRDLISRTVDSSTVNRLAKEGEGLGEGDTTYNIAARGCVYITRHLFLTTRVGHKRLLRQPVRERNLRTIRFTGVEGSAYSLCIIHSIEKRMPAISILILRDPSQFEESFAKFFAKRRLDSVQRRCWRECCWFESRSDGAISTIMGMLARGEDSRETIIVNNDYDDSVHKVYDEENEDSLNIPTQFTNDFPSTNGVKKARSQRSQCQSLNIKVTDIQQGGQNGCQPTEMSEHEHFRGSDPPSPDPTFKELYIRKKKIILLERNIYGFLNGVPCHD
ncbi:hypothetical protein PR048_011903 [Dryococelus australis]|uniref:Uncharacterized protein n=1 Tax=Dryococelus australis TaxID=614101 RepID=A0ABQ9HMU0_9NEOP|nr:hypothetical protein PR048_011903 [Dryococelus australis]